MTLQELIAELLALNLAYPDNTRVAVRVRDQSKGPLTMVVTESEHDNIEIVLQADY